MFACGTFVGPEPYPWPLLLFVETAAAWVADARVFSLLGARWAGLGRSVGKEDVLLEKAGFCCGVRLGDDGVDKEVEEDVGGDSDDGDRVGDNDGDRGLPPPAAPPVRAVSGDRLDALFVLLGMGDVGDVTLAMELLLLVLVLALVLVEVVLGLWSNEDRRPGSNMGLEFLLILAFLTGTFLPFESDWTLLWLMLLLLLLLIPVPCAFSLLPMLDLLMPLLVLRMVEELGLYLLL